MFLAAKGIHKFLTEIWRTYLSILHTRQKKNIAIFTTTIASLQQKHKQLFPLLQFITQKWVTLIILFYELLINRTWNHINLGSFKSTLSHLRCFREVFCKWLIEINIGKFLLITHIWIDLYKLTSRMLTACEKRKRSETDEIFRRLWKTRKTHLFTIILFHFCS